MEKYKRGWKKKSRFAPVVHLMQGIKCLPSDDKELGSFHQKACWLFCRRQLPVLAPRKKINTSNTSPLVTFSCFEPFPVKFALNS